MEIIAHRAVSDAAGRPQPAVALCQALRGCADRVELDITCLDGRLVVAHDPREARRLPGRLTVDDALAVVAASDRGLLADIKGHGAAELLGEALVAAALAGRTIVCGELEQVELACELSGAIRAWTLPAARAVPPARAVRPGPTSSLAAAHAGLLGRASRGARLRVERAAAEALGGGRCDAVSVERRFVTVALLDAVHARAGRLLAWTVDDPSDASRLAELGVDGLITNEPDELAAYLSGRSAQWSDG
jgi:glycerophosphoryl diester phosphodiesterase